VGRQPADLPATAGPGRRHDPRGRAQGRGCAAVKGYQQLVDEQLVEKRRGRGMFVSAGARNALMKDERQRFLQEEWPKVYATIQRLGLSSAELLRNGAPPSTPPWPTTPGKPDDDSH